MWVYFNIGIYFQTVTIRTSCNGYYNNINLKADFPD